MDNTRRFEPGLTQHGLESSQDQQITLPEHPFQSTQWNAGNPPLYQVDQHQQIPGSDHQWLLSNPTSNDQNAFPDAGPSFAQMSFPTIIEPQDQLSVDPGDPTQFKGWCATEHLQSLDDQQMYDLDNLWHARDLAAATQPQLEHFTPLNVPASSGIRKRKAPTLKAADWNPVKSYVIKTHIEEGQPLEKVMEQVETKFGLIANKRQYRTRISQWKKDKNVKKTEMQAIVRKQHRRNVQEPEKPPLSFTVRGKAVSQEKVLRWMRRNNLPINGPFSPVSTATTPSALECKTISEFGPASSSSDESSTAHDPIDWVSKFACKYPFRSDVIIVRWQSVEVVQPEPLRHQVQEDLAFVSTSLHTFEATVRLRETLRDMSSGVVQVSGNRSDSFENGSASDTFTHRGCRDCNDVMEFQLGPVLIDHDSLGSTEDIMARLPGKVKRRSQHDLTDSSEYAYDTSSLDDIQLLAQSYISHGFRVEIREAEDFQIPALNRIIEHPLRRISLSNILDAWAQDQDDCDQGHVNQSREFDDFDITLSLEVMFGPDCVATLWGRQRYLSWVLCQACHLELQMHNLPNFTANLTADLDAEFHSHLNVSPRIHPGTWWYLNSLTFVAWLAGKYDRILEFNDEFTVFPFDKIFGPDHPEVLKFKFIVEDARERGAWSMESMGEIIRYNKLIEKKRKVDVHKPLVLLAWKE